MKNLDGITKEAICLLNAVGINEPNMKQVSLIETLLKNTTITATMLFDSRLTQREKQCLYWAAMGKSSQETSELLDVTKHTIELHRKKIKKKLQCRSLAQAVYVALRFDHLALKDPGYFVNFARKSESNFAKESM